MSQNRKERPRSGRTNVPTLKSLENLNLGNKLANIKSENIDLGSNTINVSNHISKSFLNQ
jgi:hypothetical protein